MLYFGPETYMPVASVLAGLVGILLTFWRRLVGWVRRILPGRARHAPPDPSSRRSRSRRSRDGES